MHVPPNPHRGGTIAVTFIPSHDNHQQSDAPPLPRPARRASAGRGPVTLPDGRRLGYAEFGDPKGDDLGVRVVVLGRPGSGLSDPHAYEAVADILGAERLSAVGLSNPSDDFMYWYNMITKIPGGGN